MTNRFQKLAAALALALVGGSTGCTSTWRSVTSQAWFNNDTAFVAYTEAQESLFSSSYQAKVLTCHRQQDNSLACAEQPELNKFLNEDSTVK